VTLTVKKLATAEAATATTARTAVRGTFGQGRADTAGRGSSGAREAAVGRARASGRVALSERRTRRGRDGI
jgi:hypothetical protein